MNIDKSVFGILSILVAVIVVATVAIPIVESSGTQIYTTENNTTERFMMASDSSEVVTLGFSTANGYSVNGVTVPQPSTSTWNVKAFWPGGFAKYNGTGFMEINGNGEASRFNVTKIVYDPAASTLTYTTLTEDVVVNDVPYMYYMANDGDYGLFVSTNPVSINKDTDYFIFVENTNLTGTGAFRSGFVYNNDSLVETIIDPKLAGSDRNFQDTTITFNLNIEDVDRYHFTIDGVTDLTVGGSVISSQTITIVAPIEYKAVSQNDSAMISILQIVPLLLLIVPVMMAVRMYSSRGE